MKKPRRPIQLSNQKITNRSHIKYLQFLKTKETEGTLNVLRRQSCNPDFVTRRMAIWLTNRTCEDTLKSNKPDITEHLTSPLSVPSSPYTSVAPSCSFLPILIRGHPRPVLSSPNTSRAPSSRCLYSSYLLMTFNCRVNEIRIVAFPCFNLQFH